MIRMEEAHIDGTVIREAGRILREGGLVAFPTETVYGLGGDALTRSLPEKYMRRREDLRITR